MQEMYVSMSDCIGILLRRWKLIFVPAVSLAILAYFLLNLLPARYEATVFLRVGRLAGVQIETAGEITAMMESPSGADALGDAVAATGGAKVPARVTYRDQGRLLEISAVSSSPESAAVYARAAADVVQKRHDALYDRMVDKNLSMVKDLGSAAGNQPVLVDSGGMMTIEKTVSLQNGPVQAQPLRKIPGRLSLALFLAAVLFDLVVAFVVEERCRRRLCR